MRVGLKEMEDLFCVQQNSSHSSQTALAVSTLLQLLCLTKQDYWNKAINNMCEKKITHWVQQWGKTCPENVFVYLKPLSKVQ